MAASSFAQTLHEYLSSKPQPILVSAVSQEARRNAVSRRWDVAVPTRASLPLAFAHRLCPTALIMELLGIRSWHVLQEAGVKSRQATMDEARGQTAPIAFLFLPHLPRPISGVAGLESVARKRLRKTGGLDEGLETQRCGGKSRKRWCSMRSRGGLARQKVGKVPTESSSRVLSVARGSCRS